MAAQTICSNCNILNLASAYYCKKCGQVLPKGQEQQRFYTLTWLGWTLFTVTLLSFTLISIGQLNIDMHPTIKVEVFQPAPKPEKPPEVDSGDETYIPDATGSNGCKASVLLYLLSDEYSWQKGYSERLSEAQERINFTEQMRSNINNNAAEVITIGASSEDIAPHLAPEAGRENEERRAGVRANTIAKWVKDLLN